MPWKKFKEPEHRARQPFAKIPTYEQDGLTLFESGAILLHIAKRYPGLLPADPNAREQAIVWLFAALNTVEPPIVEREATLLMEKDRPRFAERQKLIDDNVRQRLTDLTDFLGGRDWLLDEFSVADLMMITVLRRLKASNFPDAVMLLDGYPALLAYVQRGKERLAYARALEAKKADFEKRRARRHPWAARCRKSPSSTELHRVQLAEDRFQAPPLLHRRLHRRDALAISRSKQRMRQIGARLVLA